MRTPVLLALAPAAAIAGCGGSSGYGARAKPARAAAPTAIALLGLFLIRARTASHASSAVVERIHA